MSVAVYQNPWELEMLLRVLTEEDFFENVLEIGAYEGGTLRHWLNLAPEVVIVDDEMRNADLWEAWAEDQHAVLALLQGDSHDPEVIAKAEELGPYSFVFIDAGHTYADVEADWNAYGQMGKLVGLHDILPRPGYGVSELWAMLKQEDRRWMEICHNVTLEGNEGPCGVGLVWRD